MQPTFKPRKTPFLDQLSTFADLPRLIQRLRNKIQFPGLGMGRDVQSTIRGTIEYGTKSNIGTQSILVIPSGCHLKLGSHTYVGRGVELGPSPMIQIGDHSSIQDRTILLGDVTLGRYCTLAPDVYISSGRHFFDYKPPMLIKDQDEWILKDPAAAQAACQPVVVEDDCWIGIHSVIMPGIRIGKGSVIGANAVVTKDVPPYTVAAGIPAKAIKKRLDFKPPREIHFNRLDDLPYFYSGFEWAQGSLRASQCSDGLVGSKDISLSLEGSAGGTLNIMVRSLDGAEGFLHYHNQKAPLAGEFRAASFAIPQPASRHDLWVEGDSGGLMVQKAWIS